MRKSRSTSLSTKSRGAFVFVLILCHLAASPNETSALGQIAGQKKDSPGQRVEFRIVTRVTDSESEETISEAVVEGPHPLERLGRPAPRLLAGVDADGADEQECDEDRPVGESAGHVLL